MIIVSGASKGIGKYISENLSSSKNYEILGLSRTRIKSNFDTIECDITDFKSLKNISLKLKKDNLKIEAIINVAGIASMNMALTTNHDTVKNIINTNLLGTINMCQAFAPNLIRQRKGSIINFSTIAVPLSIKGESIYAASKSGVETFSKVFAREMSDFNIRVNCIAPGPIKTDLLKGISDKQINDIVKKQIIPKRFDKSDILDLVKFLISDNSSSLSGQILNVGGV